jgi:pimeloyl-ACP methyl ester carboxylesterase
MTILEFGPPAFVELGSLRIAYREWGSPTAARVVVLIHGITGSSLSWVRVAPVLAERYHVIAVDLKGHGDSDRAETGYRFSDQAREVAALCQSLGLQRPSVVGHSWGGAVAVHLATSTALVDRLVLEDPALGLRGIGPRDLLQVRESCAHSVGLTREEAARHMRESPAPGWTELDVAGKIDAMTKGSPAAVRAVFVENDPWDLHHLIHRLRCPTLLLRAPIEHGGIVDQEAVALAEANPQVRVATIARADHDVHRTQYAAFIAEVEPFLAGAPRTADARVWGLGTPSDST